MIEGLVDYLSSIGSGNLIIWNYKVKKSGEVIVTEYFDRRTGEIIPRKLAKVKEVQSDAMIERAKRLDSLRDEVRKFAVFVLYFRNTACGFLIPMDTIKSWYSKYSGKRSNNINRLVQKLIEGGILENEIQLSKVFMLNNPNRTKRDALADVFIAESKFSILMLKKRASESILQ